MYMHISFTIYIFKNLSRPYHILKLEICIHTYLYGGCIISKP